MEPANNSSIIPSARDLFLVLPRLAQRAGSFVVYLPEAMDNIADKIWNGGSAIAGATAQQTAADSTITNLGDTVAQSTASTLESTLGQAWTGQTDGASSSFLMGIARGIDAVKSFGGIFSYLTSRWGLSTFTAAIILNRTQFYASSREALHIRFHVRLALYIIPIAAFVTQMINVLQTMKCQTSPDFPQMRYGDLLKHVATDFASEGGFLYWLSSTLLFWQDDASCCAARQMSMASLEGDTSAPRGSMALLYWFFLTLCLSQLFETLCCALQGRQPVPETGMTIFEHSLAFAECEAIIGDAVGLGFFRNKKISGMRSPNQHTGQLPSRAEILQQLNVPPEILLICLISCFSHLSSSTLAVSGIRHKVRLVNTAVWACCYMSAFIWSISNTFTGSVENVTDLGILRFPTVCIIGFIPHVLIMIGISICGVIYGLAILVTAFSVPRDIAEGSSFRQRLAWAYNNLQANVQFSQSSSISIRLADDFYTTLLKIGFIILTAASEAVYLNEGSRINVAQMTWLEQKRIDEMATTIERRQGPSVPSQLLSGGIARGVGFVDTQNAATNHSPYARERKSRPTKTDSDKRNEPGLDSGLGLAQRRSRIHLTFDFVAGIFWLIVGLQAQLMLNLLHRLGLEQRPWWLLRAAGIRGTSRGSPAYTRPVNTDLLDFYVIGADGSPSLPISNDFDVEAETRRRVQRTGTYKSEDHINDEMYRWWRTGGRFGDVDASGDYQTAEEQDDLTSVISESTDASTTDGYEETGQRTPTQQHPSGDFFSRESTPMSDPGMEFSSLSRLLNPRSATEREEAILLSHTLQSNRPMTRSQYRRSTEQSRAELLKGLRLRGTTCSQPLSEEEEEHDLEQFILSQRTAAKAKAQRSSTWESGAEGMGDGGPQCVVCQSTPRTILVWPCGCLSMCDECRVGLAARNYTKCICCRTDIAAYSRLYVP